MSAATMRPYQVMPPLSDEERAALRADIAERGVLVPVVTDQHGTVIDGHHRQEIAGELGVPYRVDVVEVAGEDEARSVARMYNLARRHLTREQKRQLVADELTARPGRSDREIARMMRCDHKTVGSVRREMRGEIPHPAELSAVQRQWADALYGLMRTRAVEAYERKKAWERENPGKDSFGMFTLHTQEECDDRAVIAEAWRRYGEWATTSEAVRGFLWDWAEGA